MKVHLAKRLSGNRITTSRSECGKNKHSSRNQVLMIVKTTAFKNSNEESKCINCLAKAKEQNRI